MSVQIKTIFKGLKFQKKMFSKMILGLLIIKLMTTLIPVLIGSGVDVISTVSKGKDANPSNQFLIDGISVLSQKYDIGGIFFVAGGLLFLSLILVMLAPWQQKLQARVIQKVVFDVTVDWIEKVFKKDLQFFKEKNAARTANILSRGIHGHEKLLNQVINVLLPVIVEFALAAVILTQIGGIAALAFIVFSVLAQAFLTLYIIRYRRPFISELNDIEDESAEQTMDFLSKGLIFQIYGATEPVLEKLGRIYHDYADQCVKISSSGAHLSWLPFQFQTLGSAVALILGFYLVQNQGHSLGQVLILISFFSRFSSAASECVGSFRILDQFKLDVQEAEKMLKYRDFSRPGQQIESLTAVEIMDGMLNRDGVKLQIPQGIEFKVGDQVALIGASGSGKSTLLEIFGGLDVDSRNSLRWNGIQLSDLSSEEQLRWLKYAPQDPMIFKGTFSDNVFQKKLLDESVVRCLEVSHLQDDSREGISMASISGGEAKRIALLRALSSETGIYLMDEPTAGLNENLRQKAWKAIQEKTRNGILIAVTHDQDEFFRFNKILSVEQGTVKILKWEDSSSPVYNDFLGA